MFTVRPSSSIDISIGTSTLWPIRAMNEWTADCRSRNEVCPLYHCAMCTRVRELFEWNFVSSSEFNRKQQRIKRTSRNDPSNFIRFLYFSCNYGKHNIDNLANLRFTNIICLKLSHTKCIWVFGSEYIFLWLVVRVNNSSEWKIIFYPKWMRYMQSNHNANK